MGFSLPRSEELPKPNKLHVMTLNMRALLLFRRQTFLRRVQRDLLKLLLAVGSCNILDLMELHRLPPGVEQEVFAKALSELSCAAIIEPNGDADLLQRWKLTEAAAGLAWLELHPELPRKIEIDGVRYDL